MRVVISGIAGSEGQGAGQMQRQDERVPLVRRVVEKRVSSPLDLWTRDGGTRIVVLGWDRREDVQGCWRKGSLESDTDADMANDGQDV